MARNSSLSLGSHFDGFVEQSIAEGRYKDVHEVIRAGLRLLEEEESRLRVLKSAIQEGVDSGIVEDFDPVKHLKAMKKRRKAHGGV
ncbi:MAG: type II toxin-antitoxin system ParD family antitoxin [Flavobacteriales bacterium]